MIDTIAAVSLEDEKSDQYISLELMSYDKHLRAWSDEGFY